MGRAFLYEELVDQCFDFIDDSKAGYQALCACLLVSQPFLHRARYRVFNNIQVYTDKDAEIFAKNFAVSDRVEKLRRLLEYKSPAISLPQLASYIKSASFDYTKTDSYMQLNFDVEHDHLPTVLNQIRDACCLQSFTLASNNSFYFRDSTEGLKQSMRELCQMPSIKSLVLHGVCDLPVAMVLGPALRELQLKETTFYPRTSESIPMKKDLPRLETLACHFSGHPKDLPRLYKGLDTSFLRNLRCLRATVASRTNFNRARLEIQSVLDASSSSLESFIYQPNVADTNSSSLNLNKLSAIRSIYFVLMGDPSVNPTGDYRTTFNNINSLMNSMSSFEQAPASLHELTICMKGYCEPKVVMTGVREEDVDRWKEFDVLLTGPRFGSLKRIQILLQVQKLARFSFAPMTDTSDSTLVPFIHRLPNLMSRLWKDSRLSFLTSIGPGEIFNSRDIQPAKIFSRITH